MAHKFEQEYKMVGLKIAYFRKLCGSTQEQLAEKFGVATAYIGQIEAASMYCLKSQPSTLPRSPSAIFHIAECNAVLCCSFNVSAMSKSPLHNIFIRLYYTRFC